MRTLIRRVAFWLGRHRFDAELAEELENHRAMEQERLERSGMPAKDAACASRRALGNVTLAREEARSVWIWPWLDGVRQDVAYALRSLRRNPAFSAAVILVTSLGIAATTSVFGLVDGLVLKPLPVRDPGRLVYFASPSFSYPIFSEMRTRGTGMFSGFFAWNLDSVNVDWNGQFEPAEVLLATGEFYSTLGIQAALGRTFGVEDDQPGGGAGGLVATISYACWQRRFGGDGSVIGRIVTHRSSTVHDCRCRAARVLWRRGRTGSGNHDPPDGHSGLAGAQINHELMAAPHGTAARWCQPRSGECRPQEHLARRARGHDDSWRTCRPTGQVPGQADGTPRWLGRLLARPTSVRRAPVDPLRAGRAVIRGCVRQRNQLVAGSRRRASA